jgi:spore coat polysaccharide biosynthesis predicted glycosyltransferase SpsG/RimJ/RimL family protein N-acetyltransferase
LAAVGPKIGLGHLMRCLAVAEWIKSDFDVNLIPQNFDQEIMSLLERRGFICDIPLKPVDLLLVDGYNFTNSDLHPYLHSDTQVVWISDFSAIPPHAAAIVNHAPGITREDYPNFYGHLGLGLNYAMVAPLFFSASPNSSNSNTALVCLGGSDWNNLTQQVAQWILESSAYDVHAVVGPYYEHESALIQLKIKFSERFNWSRGLNQNALATAMQSVVFGVFSASNTLYEALAAQLPSIAGYYTANQMGIYQGFTQMDLVWGCDGFDEQHLKNHLKALSAEVISQRKQQLQHLWAQQPGEAWKQLLQQLGKDSSFSIRSANANDCLLYFDWANDPEVRTQAFSSEAIIWEAHQNWFSKKLESEASQLFVLEKMGTAVGQIRFDFHDGYWWIDYSISKDFRGQSLSKTLLRRGLQKMHSIYGTAAIRAQVKISNVPSQRAFESIQAHRIKTQPQESIVLYDLSL